MHLLNFTQLGYVFVLKVFGNHYLVVGRCCQSNLIKDEVALEDLTHFGLQLDIVGLEEMLGGCPTQSLKGINFNYFSQLGHSLTMLISVGGVTAVGEHHLKEDIHEVDNFEIVCAFPLI